MKLLKRSIIAAVTLAGVLAGTATPAGAIVGGRDATQSYDGMVSVQIVFPGLGTALCGGTLIHPQWVETAAHCVSDDDAAPTPVAVPGSNITVRIGSTNRQAGGQVVTGRKVYLPPGWAWGANWPSGPVSDYALIELTRPVAAPLMPKATAQPPEQGRARLIGWGLNVFPPSAGATPPTMLQERDIRRLPNPACEGGFIGAGEVCVGAGACFGDSGGPELIPDRGPDFGTRPGWASAGVASRETSQQTPCHSPTVYTDSTDPRFRLWAATTIRTRADLPCTCPPLRSTGTDATQELTDLLKIKTFL